MPLASRQLISAARMTSTAGDGTVIISRPSGRKSRQHSRVSGSLSRICSSVASITTASKDAVNGLHAQNHCETAPYRLAERDGDVERTESLVIPIMDQVKV